MVRLIPADQSLVQKRLGTAVVSGVGWTGDLDVVIIFTWNVTKKADWFSSDSRRREFTELQFGVNWPSMANKQKTQRKKITIRASTIRGVSTWWSLWHQPDSNPPPSARQAGVLPLCHRTSMLCRINPMYLMPELNGGQDRTGSFTINLINTQELMLHILILFASVPFSSSVFPFVCNLINWAERRDKEGSPWGAVSLPSLLVSLPTPLSPSTCSPSSLPLPPQLYLCCRWRWQF